MGATEYGAGGDVSLSTKTAGATSAGGPSVAGSPSESSPVLFGERAETLPSVLWDIARHTADQYAPIPWGFLVVLFIPTAVLGW